MALRRFRYAMKHNWLTAVDIGQLVPIFSQEVTPGDTWSGSSFGLFRVLPMDKPAFVALNIHVHFFFIPHRLVWPESENGGWEDFITGVSTATVPTLTKYNVSTAAAWEGSKQKLFGIPWQNNNDNGEVNALPIRALNLVWSEFFRPQSILSERAPDYDVVDQVYYPASDYYGSFRTEIQQGTEETVPSVNSVSVRDLRDAFHRQRVKERRSQFGERFTDLLLADYGIRAPDSRLDRPEHVARGRGTIGISEVLATATSAAENTGDFRGHGISGVRVRFPKRMFVEHGTLLGVAYTRPRNQLKYRTDRQFLSSTKEDFHSPLLARDTQVPIVDCEVSRDGDSNTVWAYTRRDEWLRTARDTIASDMMDGNMDPWHGARSWDEAPAHSAFLQVDGLQKLFQDQTLGSEYVLNYWNHGIGKTSVIPKAETFA